MLLVRQGLLRGQRLLITTPVTNLGRAHYNDVQLPDPSVGAGHAKLQLREGIWLLSDLGSSRGSSVDGEPVTGELPLPPGATVRLGEVVLVFDPRDSGVPPRDGIPTAGPAVTGARRPAVPPRRRSRILWVAAALGVLALGGFFLLG